MSEKIVAKIEEERKRSEKRIAELEEELKREKRLKIENDYNGSIEAYIDKGLEAWRNQLDPLLQNSSGAYVLKIYPLAGRSWREESEYDEEEKLAFQRDSKWSFAEYLHVKTRGWNPLVTVFAESLQALVPEAATLFSVARIVYFIHETKYDVRFDEDVYTYPATLFSAKAPANSVPIHLGWTDVPEEYDLTTEYYCVEAYIEIMKRVRQGQKNASDSLKDRRLNLCEKLSKVEQEIEKVNANSELILSVVYPLAD